MANNRAVESNESSRRARKKRNVLAHAKINLTLEILARRDDGYHALRSVMLPIGIADELEFTPALTFGFACQPPELEADNLIVRAFRQIGLAEYAVHVTLQKHIPAGAGLGGGSSDAAAVLLTAQSGAFGRLPPRDWLADARALGSDVPFFLAGGGALVEGTGERVTALGELPPWWLVVLVPAVHVATPDAFRRLALARAATPAALRPRSESASLRVLTAVQRADYDAAIAAATNDFEPIVRTAYPAVAAVLDALRTAAAGHAMLSGSGGACFSLCRTETAARDLAERVTLPPATAMHVVPFAPTPAWRRVA